MSNIIDISMEISSDMVLWPGTKAPVKITKFCSIDDGQIANSSRIEMGMHTGTHVDAPLHFVASGKSTSTIDLDKFIGKAKVFDIDSEHNVGVAELMRLSIEEGDIILLNIARNNCFLADEWFHDDYIALDAEGAQYLVDKKIKAVGINYYSIEDFNPLPDCPVHKTLLGNGVVVYEGLKLDCVRQGEYFLSCLPLKFKEGNGSPVRAILIQE